MNEDVPDVKLLWDKGLGRKQNHFHAMQLAMPKIVYIGDYKSFDISKRGISGL